eukprot:COSAG01_NODE_3322_length_6257_cov_9.805294_2_plen_132_part_00
MFVESRQMPLHEQRSSDDDYQQRSRVQFANNQDTFETDPSPAAPDRRRGKRNSGGTAHKHTPFGTLRRLRSETYTLKDGSVVPRLFTAPPDNLEFHNAVCDTPMGVSQTGVVYNSEIFYLDTRYIQMLIAT